jgi:hypothetical protein
MYIVKPIYGNGWFEKGCSETIEVPRHFHAVPLADIGSHRIGRVVEPGHPFHNSVIAFSARWVGHESPVNISVILPKEVEVTPENVVEIGDVFGYAEIVDD